MERESVLKVTTLRSPGAAVVISLKWPRLPIAITPFVLGIGSGTATIVAYTARPSDEDVASDAA